MEIREFDNWQDTLFFKSSQDLSRNFVCLNFAQGHLL